MDIRRQTAQELQGGSTVPDGRTSSGGHGNRLSTADRIGAINRSIGRTSVTSRGSSAADSLAALAERNDMAVGGQTSALSVRSGNVHSVSFMHNSNSATSGGIPGSGANGTSGNVVLPVPSGPSSLVGNCVNTGILDTSGGVVEPLDYEEYVQQQQRAYGNVSGRVSSSSVNTRGPITDEVAGDDSLHLIDFPADDIEVNVVPRKIRTVQHIVPEEPL